jgi:hypothetical protein
MLANVPFSADVVASIFYFENLPNSHLDAVAVYCINREDPVDTEG